MARLRFQIQAWSRPCPSSLHVLIYPMMIKGPSPRGLSSFVPRSRINGPGVDVWSRMYRIVATSLRIFSSGNVVAPGLENRMTAEPPSANFMRNITLKSPALGSHRSTGTPLRRFTMKWPIARSALSSTKIPSTQLSVISSLFSQAIRNAPVVSSSRGHRKIEVAHVCRR